MPRLDDINLEEPMDLQSWHDAYMDRTTVSRAAIEKAVDTLVENLEDQGYEVSRGNAYEMLLATTYRALCASEKVQGSFTDAASVHAWAGTYCSVCGDPQYTTPSGAVCDNGHGGAAGVDHPSKATGES